MFFETLVGCRNVSVLFDVNEENPIRIWVTDILGRTIYDEQLVTQKGRQSISLFLSDKIASSGTYLLHLSSAELFYTEKLLFLR